MPTSWLKTPSLLLAVFVMLVAALACNSGSPAGTAPPPEPEAAVISGTNQAADPDPDGPVSQAMPAQPCGADAFQARLAETSGYVDLAASSFQDQTVVFKDGYAATEEEAQRKSAAVSRRLLQAFPCLDSLTVIIYLDGQQFVSTTEVADYDEVLDMSLDNFWPNVDRLLAYLGITDEPVAQEFARENFVVEPSSGGPGPLVTAGDSNINIRSGPGTDYPVIGTLPAGESMAITGRNADASWWQVETPGGAGWIAAFVTTASNTDQPIPVVDGTSGAAPALDPGQVEGACHPNARITAPDPGAPFTSRVVVIRGYANVPDFHHYRIEYSTDPDGDVWNLLFEEEKPVENDVLMQLETSTVPYGPYGVRLTVVDTAGDSPAPCIRWFNDQRFVTPEPAGAGSQSQPAPDPAENVPCLCAGDYYDCSSFGGPAAAQECFEYCLDSGQGDIHRLDQDNDGTVCNSD